jgi:hypothetical protein
MATDLTLERIQYMKEKLFLAFNHLATPPTREPTERDIADPVRMADFRRGEELIRRGHIERSADRLVGLSNSFASLVLAEAALTTGQVAIIPQPNGPKPSGGREPRELER